MIAGRVIGQHPITNLTTCQLCHRRDATTRLRRVMGLGLVPRCDTCDLALPVVRRAVA